jgi:hypothetical protein
MSELADFVLGAFRQVGGIVEPPAYGVYEALLPEEVARRWNVPAYQRLAFADQVPAEMTEVEDATVVGYDHPLVETLMEEVRAEPACVQVYVNDVRLDKRGLLKLADEEMAFPNARLSEIPRQKEIPALCHYVRFNLKAALITDEKHERLVSVVMDAQTGVAVPELTDIEQLTPLAEETAFGHLSSAPARWLLGSGREGDVLSRAVLEELLERATHAALGELGEPLEKLHRRADRHLELDRARLIEYYEGITRDLQRRIKHSSDGARRTLAEDKLAAAQAERESKLADVEAKYRLRVEMKLVNLQIISQPKILLPVRIGNRTVGIERTVVWDPLLHRIEPLACDVCGQAATQLVLCSGGHLVHKGCLLLEQCIDCKRVYCRLCADQMGCCVVCGRPVCRHSLNHCATCGRATCHEHVELCHAADGEPIHLSSAPSPKREEEMRRAAEPLSPPPPTDRVEEKLPPSPPLPSRSGKRAHKAAVPGTQTVRRSVRESPRVPTPYKIEVYIDPRAPVVDAFVLTKGKKQIAVRSWELIEEGIAVRCRCEKWYHCSADGTVLELVDASGVETQIETQIEELRQEYGISARRVFRYAVVRGASRQVPRVVLRGEWRKQH